MTPDILCGRGVQDVDLSLWKTDDKAWMNNRKEEWKNVKRSLDAQNAIKKKHYKYHKQLFFFGDLVPHVLNEDMTYFQPFHPGTPLLYMLWYYPVADLTTFRNLIEAHKDAKYINVSETGKTFLFQFPVTRPSRGKYDRKYGMMGGREELIVRALFPSYNYEDTTVGYRNSCIHLAPHPKMVLRYIEDSLHPLFGGYNEGSNIFTPGQYLWDHFDHCIDAVRQEVIDARPDRFYQLLYIIKHWESWGRFPRDDERVVAIAEKLRARFDNREFGATLMDYWDNIDALYAAHPE